MFDRPPHAPKAPPLQKGDRPGMHAVDLCALAPSLEPLAPEPWRCIMFKQHERVHLAATRLIEVADRVLGGGATRFQKYSYLNGMLTRLERGLDPALKAQLRVACYERLFEADRSGTPPRA